MYSTYWFDIFLNNYPNKRTKKEINFIQKKVPNKNVKKILDLCCGNGRHLLYFQNIYKYVTGIDISNYALEQAKSNANKNVTLINMDMRSLKRIKNRFNAIFSLWQSFGYFSKNENISILKNIYNLLLLKGYLFLDIYNLDFFRKNTGQRIITKDSEKIIEKSRLIHNRLSVELVYQKGNKSDLFEWELYSPESISEILQNIGFTRIEIYSDFNQNKQPTEKDYKMQVIATKQ